MRLKLLHVRCGRKLITFNRSCSSVLVICPTEENSVCRRECQLRTIIMCQLPRILGSIKLNLFKYSLSCSANHAQGINGVVIADGYGRVSHSFNSSLFGTGRVHQSLATILISYSIGNNNTIEPTSDYHIILPAPGQTFNLS
jgi:hypothetical protein